MRWVRHVARARERRGAYRVLVGKAEGRRQHGMPKRQWRIILKCIFKKCDTRRGLD
jgi:hypothetical protein